MEKPAASVLFVCLGNICRSPTAEGIFRDLVERESLSGKISVDSAGTGNWHIGEPPDSRAIQAAADRDIDISGLRARQASAADFERFDYVLAMDQENYQNLRQLSTGTVDNLHLLMAFADNPATTEVPDPYYGGGFPEVFSLIEQASSGLLVDIKRRHLS